MPQDLEFEVSYNVKQALLYMIDMLGKKNGCVVLPAQNKLPSGTVAEVTVIDDLATLERSRWEIWATVFHRRFSK